MSLCFYITDIADDGSYNDNVLNKLVSLNGMIGMTIFFPMHMGTYKYMCYLYARTYTYRIVHIYLIKYLTRKSSILPIEYYPI